MVTCNLNIFFSCWEFFFFLMEPVCTKLVSLYISISLTYEVNQMQKQVTLYRLRVNKNGGTMLQHVTASLYLSIYLYLKLMQKYVAEEPASQPLQTTINQTLSRHLRLKYHTSTFPGQNLVPCTATSCNYLQFSDSISKQSTCERLLDSPVFISL